MKATRSKMKRASDAERKARAIPPAYTDAMIAVDVTADLQATAITPAGKTAYFYSKAFIERQVAAKWKRVAAVTKRIDSIAAKVEADSEAGISEALTIRLILQTGMRNGGKKQGKLDAFGASSIRIEHMPKMEEGDSEISLAFPGKKGVAQAFTVKDPVLARHAFRRQQEKAETLFEHTAADTLRYLRSVGGPKIKVHDLRTWYANVLAEALVAKMLTDDLTMKKLKKAVATEVASKLGNTPSMALKAYINPKVFGE